MEIKEVKQKEVWEGFFKRLIDKTFLQSWDWGEFQKKMGEKVWRIAVFEENRMIAFCQTVLISAKRGKFLFLAHGPFFREKEGFSFLLSFLKKKAEEEKCSFIRIAPLLERNEKNKKIFKDLGFKQAPMHTHPELTWQLDLNLKEEKLLMNMRKTTRYLIRQGIKNKDLEIIKSSNVKDVELFNELYLETVKYHHFHPFSLKYLKEEFLSFSPNSVIFLAKHKGKYLASAIILFWSGIGFYHQGASIHTKVPASYLMQWEAIKEAKKRGCFLYNFWGIADSDSKNHPWYGLSLFKKGFGGYEKKYLKTQDLPLSFKYYLTRWFEILRKKKRRL